MARIADELLEATVVGSFSRIGYEARSRLGAWSSPPSVTGARVMVTGATSGLGEEAATWLASLGAEVTFLARDEGRARQARARIGERAGASVSFLLADLSDQASIRRAAARYLDGGAGLDVLIHNAGMLTHEYQQAPEGAELTVATHVLGPFLLTGLLLAALDQRRPEVPGPARVITVSSGGMYSKRFDLAELDSAPDGFDGVAAYARAKRAQVVLAHEWARRMDPARVVFHTMHPGWADTPGARSSLPGFSRVTGPILRSPRQGVDTLVWLAAAPEATRSSGGFWLDRRPRSEYKLPWTRSSDPGADQAALWEWCERRTGWSGPTAA